MFQWTYGPPLPAGLSPEERSAMTRQRLEEIFEITLRPRRIELGVDWEADSTRPRWDVAPAEEEGGLAAVVPGGADG